MNKHETIEKAIKKAVKNGANEIYLSELYLKSIETLIFNHDFARALWGEEYEKYESSIFFKKKSIGSFPNYQIHLGRMVLSRDPIKYLADNI
jgi:hypothetical protein